MSNLKMFDHSISMFMYLSTSCIWAFRDVPVKLVFDRDKLIFCPEQSRATLLVLFIQIVWLGFMI